MTRTAVALVAAIACLAFAPVREARGQARILAAVISSVEPVAPPRSDAAQLLTIRGTTFLDGLSLNVVTPDGPTVSYSGTAIRARRETSFQVAVVLAASGNYKLTVTNRDRSTSDPFVLKVPPSAQLADARPRIDRVLPEQPTKDTQAQMLRIGGERFVEGLSVSLTDPIGTVYRFSSPAVGSVTATSFNLSVVLGMTGDYALMVTNPSGESSNNVTFTVVMRGA
jgi:hypothetical protein